MPGTAKFKEAKNLQRTRRPILLFGLGIVALCGGLYVYLAPGEEPPPPPPAKPKATPAAPAATTTNATPIAATPPPPPSPPPSASAPVAETPNTPPTITPVATPAVSVTAATSGPAPVADAPAPLPPPSARFVRFAEGLGPTISGVFQGSPARALIGGKIVRVGDEIDSVLGVKFVGVDAATKHLIFADRTGAQVRVKY